MSFLAISALFLLYIHFGKSLWFTWIPCNEASACRVSIIKQTNKQTSRLSLHGEVTIVALKFAMSSHFPLPKIFSPSLFPLFQMAWAARRVIENKGAVKKKCTNSHKKFLWLLVQFFFTAPFRKPKTNDQILPSPIIGSAEARVRQWLLWEVERRLWRHWYHAEIASDHAYDYLDGA